jgi:receptor protein-tyrosine kinase
MTDKTTSIERAAAMLGQTPAESAIERAARLMEQAKLQPTRLEGLHGTSVPLDLDVLNQSAAPARGIATPRPQEAFSPPPFTDRLRPTESKPITIDFEAMSRRGLLSPLGEKTRIAEEYRLIKRFLLAKAFGRNGGRAESDNLVMVTSAKPREGKTFTAINMAISIALERDVHVLLVDADLVRPTVMKTLGLSSDRGLIELLADPSLDVSDVMLRTNIDRFSLLPAGNFHHMSPELITSERMARLCHDLATRYPDRVIIFDSPPLLATSEPTMLARLVGQIVYVVEAERTSEVAVRSALELIADCPDVMMVLNKARAGLGTQNFGSYYSYYGRRKQKRK